MYSSNYKPAFGSSPANNTFGASTSTFGQPAANTSMFSSMQPANIFQNPNTSSFSTAPTNQSGFGSTLFGQQQQPSTSGLFGSTNAFVQNKPTFGFGASTAQPSLFGQQQTAQPTGSSLFQSNTQNLFGSSNTFGGQTQAGTVVKFQPVTGTDTMQKNGVAQSISTKHYCITCMKEYENKSLEELRFEDYSVNRKGPSQQPSGFGGTPFGAAAAVPGTTSLFGQQENKPAFGATPGFGHTPAFGQTAQSTAFGLPVQSNTSSLFGKPAFGAPTSSANTFGFNTAQATASNPFSANQAKPFASPPIFGTATTQSQPAFGSAVFGQTNTSNTTNLFQKPAQPATGFNAGNNMFSFNQTPTTQASTLFNVSKPNTGLGIFGSTNTGMNTFGQQNTLSNTFGKPATTTFGQPTQPTFGNLGGTLGQQPQQQPLFGNAAPKPTGLFGNTNTGGTLFSSNLFQQPNQTSFNLGATNQQPPQFPSDNTGEQKMGNNLATDSFPDGPHVFGLEPVFKENNSNTTNPSELKSLLDVSIKREELAGTRNKIHVAHPAQKRNGSQNKEFFETNQALKSSHKCLVIRKFNDNSSSIYNKYKNELIEEAEECLKSPTLGSDSSAGSSSTPLTHRSTLSTLTDKVSPTNFTSQNGSQSTLTVSSSGSDKDLKNNKKAGLRLQYESAIEDSGTFPLGPSSQTMNFADEELLAGPSEIGLDSGSPSNVSLTEEESPRETAAPVGGVILTKPEYYMLPPLKDLANCIDENGNCIVQGLTIGRRGYGNVHYSKPIDITNMNLDEIVHFRHREIIVYPDDTKKPPVGEGLNRSAQVTLDKIFPREKGTNNYITDVDQIVKTNFVENLMSITQKHNCKFVDYRPKTGSWVFKVKHFSKYAFTDSDEEECEVFNERMAVMRKQQEMPSKTISEIDEVSTTTVGLGGIVSSQIDLKAKPRMIDLVFGDGEMSPEQYDSNFEFLLPDTSLQTMKSSIFTNLDRLSTFPEEDGGFMDTADRLPEKETPEPEIKSVVMTAPKIHKIPDMSFALFFEKPTENQRCYSDLGIFRNNTYKPGWAGGCNFYNFTMVVENEVIYGLQSIGMQTEDTQDYSRMMPSVIDMLKITLEECECTFDTLQTPTFAIKEDLNFLSKQTMLFNDHVRQRSLTGKDKYLSSVWNLCTALWGRGDDSSYSRRQYFSDWLKKFSFDLSDELNLSSDVENDKLKCFARIFKLLSFHKVSEACEFASKNKLSQISLLLSQLSANERYKQWMKKYVDSFAWNEKGIIPDEFKKLYLLLSGIPVHDSINICEDLDWMRCLGLHLWYVVPAAVPIDVAVNLYKKAFKDSAYAATPKPPYVEYFDECQTYDLLYHIISMYSDSTYQLSKVLDPATHTKNIMDYRLSWHLLHLFSSMKIGLVRPTELDHLHTTFSNQLETLGFWKWAIFVLLFLENNLVKKNLVMRILDRHLNDDTSDVESDLVHIYKIPPVWIHEVKAQKAQQAGDNYTCFQHFLHMGNWQEANAIFVEHILPELFVNEQYPDLLKFIKKLEPYSRSLENWSTQSGLLKDFLDMEETLRGSEENLQYAGGVLHSLCRRIGSFPTTNDEQKLCVAELSRKCALLFKILYKSLDSAAFEAKFVDIVNMLVMPRDYKHFEVFHMIGKYVDSDQRI